MLVSKNPHGPNANHLKPTANPNKTKAGGWNMVVLENMCVGFPLLPALQLVTNANRVSGGIWALF